MVSDILCNIPFPSFELFRILPERKEILKGLFGADLIGFHTSDYMRHFMNTAEQRFEGKSSILMKQENYDNRMIHLDTFLWVSIADAYHEGAKRNAVNGQKTGRNDWVTEKLFCRLIG